MQVTRWIDFGVSGYTDSMGFRVTHCASLYPEVRIRGINVVLAETPMNEFFVIATESDPRIEQAIGHRGPFPTEEAALTYLRLVKD